jgi:hypothetical protein
MQPYINLSSDLRRTSQLPPPQATPQTRTRHKRLRSRIINFSVSESIDLTSPPSSPAPTTQQNTVIQPNNTEEFQNYENMMYDSSKSSEYQVNIVYNYKVRCKCKTIK